MNCNICKAEAAPLFEAEILNNKSISYYKCPECDFIQTETPYWLDEAYENAIADTDLGYVTRNVMQSELLSSIINISFNRKGLVFGLWRRIWNVCSPDEKSWI